MPTPVFLTGFEHGVVAVGAAATPAEPIWTAVDTTGGTPTIITTDFKHGARCLEVGGGSGAISGVRRAIVGAPNIAVASFYIKFVGSLPSADDRLFAFTTAGSFAFLKFVASDSTLRASTGSSDAASGFVVSPDVWYLVDFRVNMSANPWVVDLTVNGSAQASRSTAIAASTVTNFRIGTNVDTTTATGTVRYDDLVISTGISGDYPMGEHECLKMSPNADGTHSFTNNDFIQGDAGSGFANNATNIHTFVDETPFAAINTTDSVQQNVIRTTGYVELQLEASPSAEDAWGIQIHSQYDSDGTGANTVSLKENDGGTIRDVHTNVDVSQTSVLYQSQCKATAPSGGAYTQAKLDALRLRWGYSSDVTASPILHAIMVEAAFPVAGSQNVDPSAITSAEAFGTTVVDRPHVDPSGIATAEAFGTSILALALDPSAIASGEAFGTISALDQHVNATGIASAEAFGTTVVDRPQVDPSGVASAEAFGAAVVDRPHVDPSSIASAEALGTPVVDQPHVDPSAIASAEAFGAATVEFPPAGQLVDPAAIGSAEVFGALVVDRPHVDPSSIASGEAFGNLSLDRFLNPVAIPTDEAFGSVAVDRPHVDPLGIASGEALGTPDVAIFIDQFLDPLAIASAEAFGTLTIGAVEVDVTLIVAPRVARLPVLRRSTLVLYRRAVQLTTISRMRLVVPPGGGTP